MTCNGEFSRLSLLVLVADPLPVPLVFPTQTSLLFPFTISRSKPSSSTSPLPPPWPSPTSSSSRTLKVSLPPSTRSDDSTPEQPSSGRQAAASRTSSVTQHRVRGGKGVISGES
jgi:hypothetical protein